LGRPGSLAVCRANEEDEHTYLYGRTAVMAINRSFFFTAGPGFAFRVVHLGFVVINSALVLVFLQERRFLLQQSRH